MQQLRNDYSLTFPPLSIARYSFIQLSRLRRREVKEKCPNFETVTTGIRTRALSIASPAFYQLSYRAPIKMNRVILTFFPSRIPCIITYSTITSAGHKYQFKLWLITVYSNVNSGITLQFIIYAGQFLLIKKSYVCTYHLFIYRVKIPGCYVLCESQLG